MDTAVPFQPWALLADSSSGSTWVNHVLSSHPCAVSQGEYLMTNKTAAALFHQSPEGIAAVLRDVAARNRDALSRRGANLTVHCTRFAGGVKLKLVERDVLFGNDGNALAVAAALGRQGYNVLLLHRTNHLDSLLGRMSRKRTGVLHCKKEKAEMCKKSLNTSFVLSCARARDAIDRYRLRRRASELLFRNWPSPLNGTGTVLRLEYERLVGSPRTWLSALRLIRLLDDNDASSEGDSSSSSTRRGSHYYSGCVLRDEYQKRVTQTQRELISNYAALSSCLRRAGHAYSKLLVERRPASGALPRDDPRLCASG